jgi:hypothetical protein
MGFEPATFRLVTQCLNELRYRLPLMIKIMTVIIMTIISVVIIKFVAI